MKFAKVHRILASLTERFSLDLFNGNDTKAVVEEALDKTGKWHQREWPLKAPFMLWFVVALSLFR
ncbi:MAG: transposase domain-containing protein, partial [Armatimonadetes bacterium]|nr:transposase domain-containing protein [Armatimonadota bacterium]